MSYALAESISTVPAMDAGRAPIDRDHLSQMTLGDRQLEREVLQLFDRQAELLRDRMNQVPASSAAALAHTLKGSARGIGAWSVARAAEAVELADGTLAEYRGALDVLDRAIVQTRAAIAELLTTH